MQYECNNSDVRPQERGEGRATNKANKKDGVLIISFRG